MKLMELGKHDNVVQVYSAEIEGATPVIRMEYLEEGSVAGKFGRDALPVREALQIMEAACRGVTHIHHVGLLHRDIKPANLLLHPFCGVTVHTHRLLPLAISRPREHVGNDVEQYCHHNHD
jgi:serine/threonine protein kinase